MGENDTPEEEQLVIPEDLTGVDDASLETLGQDLLTTFNTLRHDEEGLSKPKMAELRTITSAITRVRTEADRRAEERASLDAEAEELQSQLTAMGIEAPVEPEPEPEPTPEPEPEPVVETGELVTASTSPVTTNVAQPRAGALVVKRRRLNVPMSEVARRAPDPGVSSNSNVMIVTAPDVPNYVAGRPLENLDLLSDAVHRRAKTLGNPSGQATVASIRRDYPVVLDRDAAPEKIYEIMRQAANPQALVAAGGWCAPSTIIYDFFNISCDDGLLDAPTVGVTRGGIRYPTSPSIADALDDIWLWTEADDILAVTGSGTKPCVRVPCPTFVEERLDCHGLCITAGNLTESAYPELIRNYLSLVMNAHRHVINQRIIAEIVAGSTSVTVTGTDVPITTGILGAIDLQIADYREKYRMCDNDPLEIVLPRWAKNAIRSDVAKRNGVDMLAVTDSQMMDWFDVRMARVQFVSDWQLGSTGQLGQTTASTAWPETVQFLLYAAGTWVVGNGLDLDLGVVRDSTLNAKNDHTAAWTEECNLVAQIGHESRLVTVNFCVNGATGPNSLTCNLV
jgi:hypothetical protein